jgi:hypothetical protein
MKTVKHATAILNKSTLKIDAVRVSESCKASCVWSVDTDVQLSVTADPGCALLCCAAPFAPPVAILCHLPLSDMSFHLMSTHSSDCNFHPHIFTRNTLLVLS